MRRRDFISVLGGIAVWPIGGGDADDRPLATLAARHAMPTIYALGEFAEVGG